MADESSGTGVREPVDWDEATFIADFEPPNPSLTVSGMLPYPMDVQLEPRQELVAEADYWPTEVVGYREEVVPEDDAVLRAALAERTYDGL